MYQHFYNLRELPFELTPNPRYLFLTERHREALSTLEYGLFAAKGVTVLIGEAGTGKTTLLYAALESERCRNVNCVYINNPALTREEFVETLSIRFGLSARALTSKAVMIDELERVLRQHRAAGQITALVIDEAQSLSGDLLEEIRLLANTETATQKLLPFVLAGQPELKDRLNEASLRQLKQRVTLRCEMEPFNQAETASYIAQRIRTAGGEAASLFTREAVMLIHERAGGIPRTISVICDNALLTGFGLGRRPVDSSIVLEVVQDFDLGGGRLASRLQAPPRFEIAPPRLDLSEPLTWEPPRHAVVAPVVVDAPASSEPLTSVAVQAEEPPAPEASVAVGELQMRGDLPTIRPEELRIDPLLEAKVASGKARELFSGWNGKSRRFLLFGGRRS